MKKLFFSLTFGGLLFFATPVKAATPEKEIFVGCNTWTIWCNGQPSYYAIACTVQELNVWKSLLCG